MEQQQEIFKTEAAELELLINSVSEIADDNVRQRWPSPLAITLVAVTSIFPLAPN
ncbi:hypothetical protein [Photobacterium nomapromontoriensis]|uniref:hypothetical protein n=1 Tax=Photobacterium nomapromontoriensis TaxID=2910237 RepID=UPI003D0AF90D